MAANISALVCLIRLSGRSSGRSVGRSSGRSVGRSVSRSICRPIGNNISFKLPSIESNRSVVERLYKNVYYQNISLTTIRVNVIPIYLFHFYS